MRLAPPQTEIRSFERIFVFDEDGEAENVREKAQMRERFDHTITLFPDECTAFVEGFTIPAVSIKNKQVRTL